MGIYGNMREKVGNNHVGIHFLQKEYGLISWKKIHLTLKQERVGRSMGVTKMRFNFTILLVVKEKVKYIRKSETEFN